MCMFAQYSSLGKDNFLDKKVYRYYHVLPEVRRMTFTVKMNEKESTLVKDFATLKGTTVSDIIRSAVLDRIEDELDLVAYEKALADHIKNPKTYTLDEVEKEILAQ